MVKEPYQALCNQYSPIGSAFWPLSFSGCKSLHRSFLINPSEGARCRFEPGDATSRIKATTGTHLRKYFWPVDVYAISHPGGSGSSSVTSKDWWRLCACCTGLAVTAAEAAASAPGLSCSEAGEE